MVIILNLIFLVILSALFVGLYFLLIMCYRMNKITIVRNDSENQQLNALSDGKRTVNRKKAALAVCWPILAYVNVVMLFLFCVSFLLMENIILGTFLVLGKNQTLNHFRIEFHWEIQMCFPAFIFVFVVVWLKGANEVNIYQFLLLSLTSAIADCNWSASKIKWKRKCNLLMNEWISPFQQSSTECLLASLLFWTLMLIVWIFTFAWCYMDNGKTNSTFGLIALISMTISVTFWLNIFYQKLFFRSSILDKCLCAISAMGYAVGHRLVMIEHLWKQESTFGST